MLQGGFGGDDGGEKEEKRCSRRRNEETCAQATEVGGEDAGEPGQGGSAKRGSGKERAEPGMVAGASEQEGHDERVEGSEAKCSENGKCDDAGGRDVRGGAEQNLSDDEKAEADAVESGFTEEGHQGGDEDSAGELGYPEVDGDGRSVECGIGADGVAGQPAPKGIFDADVEEDGSAEYEER